VELEALVDTGSNDDGTTGGRGRGALIGQVQLEVLDLVVDARSQEARVNPAPPDVPILDMLGVA
jgi:hypothetical protein